MAEKKKGAVSALPGPDNVLRRVLPNGITVLARENWSAPSAVVEGYVMAGGIDDRPEQMGLASYTSSMLSRGTRNRSFAEINEMVESVGAAVGFGADRFNTSFSGKSLSEDLPLVLDVLADELLHPVFPDEQIERVRGLRMTALAERENNTRQMAALNFRELCFPGHPLSYTMIGTRETNDRIDRDALVEFYETFYRPKGMLVVVVGAVAAEEAVRRVEEAFGAWDGDRASRPELPPIVRPGVVSRRKVSMPDKTQSDIVLGWPSMERLHPDYEAARLANTVLGVFGMMGRLGTSVRERQGMAYYAYSQLHADRVPGAWAVVAGVNPANVDKALDAIVVEIRRMCDEPVPAAELEDSQRYLTGSLPLQMETNDGVASVLSDLEWYGLGLDYIQRFTTLVNEVTPARLMDAAQKYLDPDAFALAVAGP